MYKFAGYGLRDTNGDLVPQMFKNRDIANGVRIQNHLPEDSIVQLFTFERVRPSTPEPTVEIDEQKDENGTT